jgi:YgiT-type zinc finger domain-containing protein
MNCLFCRGGHTHPGTGEKALSYKGTTVVLQDVPAEVCDTCGERYFAAPVVRELLALVREAAASGVVVDVRHYTAAA